jgi:hypothetical protein
MKILVDSKIINHAWQYVMSSNEEPTYREKAIELLSSILKREDNIENDVEKLLDDLELKYHRIEHSISSVNIVHDIQKLRTKLGLKLIADKNKTTNIVEDIAWETCFKTHHNAIIELLDMLIEEDKATIKWSGQGTMFKTVRQTQAEALKAKLVGDK